MENDIPVAQVYIVYQSKGSGEDYHKTVHRAFFSLGAAEQWVKENQAKFMALIAEARKINKEYNDLLNELYDKYLTIVDPEFLREEKELINKLKSEGKVFEYEVEEEWGYSLLSTPINVY